MTYHGPWDAEYIESGYERWKADPESVEKDWQAFFRGFELGRTDAPAGGERPGEEGQPKQSRVESLIYRYRDIGHLLSCLDPLAACPTSHPLLDPEAFGLGKADMERVFYFRGFPGENRFLPLDKIIGHLKRAYCGSVGVEYMHLQDPEERRWLRQQMEGGRERPAEGPADPRRILQKLCDASEFEQFIHRKYLGQKRFSVEGADTLVPMVDALISHAADTHGCGRIVMGMAHRGRLNVQVNVLGKTYEDIFREFEKQHNPDAAAGGGDVKYHAGFEGEIETPGNHRIRVTMAHNPSHLESINPVVAGMARARQEEGGKSGVMPLLLHGDAAFAGQGIVAETLNMSRLEGYGVGGTVHIVVNNQIGYTALPEDLRSTRYATDIAKMLMVPIFHVHGEDPEAAVDVVKCAVDYRMRFGKDAVIDFVCYRRYGHNEGDEPYFTQPLMYARIKDRPPVHEIYAGRLKQKGVIDEAGYEEILRGIRECLQTAYDRATGGERAAGGPVTESDGAPETDAVPETAVPADRLAFLAEKINAVPEGFRLHRKLKKLFENRFSAVKQGTGIDWANAESLAFASLAADGVPTRLSGQDSQRGTFSQRHSVVFDTMTNDPWVPVNGIGQGQAAFTPLNSLLSEAGVLGFEYGYSLVKTNGLTLWEAQFGDFANNAQAVVDLYIAAGEARWGSKSSLVMLLPHGYEGQGPDHSSARIERFLQLAANGNFRVCIPTTPAQYFHLLRRQAGRDASRPLIVITPKSLLRHPSAVSGVQDLSEGGFRDVLEDPGTPAHPEKVIFVAGKLYYELAGAMAQSAQNDIALVRIEQLYPFPEKSLSAIVDRCRGCERWLWVQEEPENMGAWRFVAPLFERSFSISLEYRGRKASASTATGYPRVFEEEQQALVREALNL